MRRRVVITGLGAVTPLGHSADETFAAALAGRSGVAAITHFNARRFPTTFAAEVKGFDLGHWLPDPGRWDDCGVNTRFALAAARQALDAAGVRDRSGIDRTRFGVYLGSGEGVQDFHNLMSLIAHTYQRDRRAVDSRAFTDGALACFHRGREAEQELHTTPAHVAEQFGLEGPNYNCLTACAASSQAVGEAAELIRRGDADLMLAAQAVRQL
jgi:3-oxoacyl-[acyl-carrier-protein] synthase II